MSPERAHSVSISAHDDGLLLITSQERTIMWSPDMVLPDDRAGEAAFVDITLYQQEHTRKGGVSSFMWKSLEALAAETPMMERRPLKSLLEKHPVIHMYQI